MKFSNLYLGLISKFGAMYNSLYLNNIRRAPAHLEQHAPGGVKPRHPSCGNLGQLASTSAQYGRPLRVMSPDDTQGPA